MTTLKSELKNIWETTYYWADFVAKRMAAEVWSTPTDEAVDKFGNDLWIYARFDYAIGINGTLEEKYRPPPNDYIRTDWGGFVRAKIEVPIERFIQDVIAECGVTEEYLRNVVYTTKGKRGGRISYLTRIVTGSYVLHYRESAEKNPSPDVYRYCTCGHTDAHHYSYYGLRGVCAFCVCRGFRAGRAEENPINLCRFIGHAFCDLNTDNFTANCSRCGKKNIRVTYDMTWGETIEAKSEENPRGRPCPTCKSGRVFVIGTICRNCARQEDYKRRATEFYRAKANPYRRRGY